MIGPGWAGKLFDDRIDVTVADQDGERVAGAAWRIRTDEYSGWAYPSEGTTAGNGRFSFAWVPGTPGDGILSLTIDDGDTIMTTQLQTQSVASENPPWSSVHAWVRMPGQENATGYMIDMTLISFPEKTFAAVRWDGGYAGFQRVGSHYDRQLQFSVWNAPGGLDAQVIEPGEGLTCRPFSGEGTGQQCRMDYPYHIGFTYRFEVTEKVLDGGSAMTLHVTDVNSGERRFIGTIRYGARARLHDFQVFVEDYKRNAPTCLEQDVLSVAFGRALALIGGDWQPLTRATWVTYEEREDLGGNPGTPSCANYDYREHRTGLELVMGGRIASDPGGPTTGRIPE